MKRLFIAVDIDEPTRAAIGRISSELRHRMDSTVRVSWVRPDRMHLTVCFFGEADALLEQRVRAAVFDPIPEAPFVLSFDGLGVFPSNGPPRVLWLGVREGLGELHRVHQALQRRLGVPSMRNAGFEPHLTLGRFRGRGPRGRLPEIASISASAGPCRIDRVTLYESRLSPAGPTYVRLAEAPLAL